MLDEIFSTPETHKRRTSEKQNVSIQVEAKRVRRCETEADDLVNNIDLYLKSSKNSSSIVFGFLSEIPHINKHSFLTRWSSNPMQVAITKLWPNEIRVGRDYI